jgi:hypothetical protein
MSKKAPKKARTTRHTSPPVAPPIVEQLTGGEGRRAVNITVDDLTLTYYGQTEGQLLLLLSSLNTLQALRKAA